MTMTTRGFGSVWKLIWRVYGLQAKKKAQYHNGNMHPPPPITNSLAAFIERGIDINRSVIRIPSLAVSKLYQHHKSFKYCTTCKYNPDDGKTPDNQSCGGHLVENDLVYGGASSQLNSKGETDGKRCEGKEKVDFKDDMVKREIALKMIQDALISASGPEEIKQVLDKESSLLSVPSSRIFLQLLNILGSNPQLALEIGVMIELRCNLQIWDPAHAGCRWWTMEKYELPLPREEVVRIVSTVAICLLLVVILIIKVPIGF